MDSRTFLAALAIMLVTITLLVIAVWAFNRRVPGLADWVASYVFALLAVMGFMLRPRLGESVAQVVMPMLTVAIAYMNLQGVRSYLRMPRWSLLAGGAGLAFIGLVAFLDLGLTTLHARYTLISVVPGALYLLGGWYMVRASSRERPYGMLFGLTCSAHGLFLALRPLMLPDLLPGQQPSFGELLAGARLAVVESMVALLLLSFGVVMLVNEHLSGELKRLADRDSLTGLHNRRAFMGLLEKAISAAVRQRASVPLLLVDLDHFKRINDTHGHQTGDLALVQFVDIALACLRREDVMGRLGGEEFAIFLPNTSRADAAQVAERLRAAVEASPLRGGSRADHLTVSIGLAECARIEDIAGALHLADEAMYRAKRLGRNRVEASPAAA